MATSKESHFYVDSDYTKDFRDGLPGGVGFAGQGASSFANLSIDPAVVTGAARLFITSVRILCMQANMDWRVEFYSKGSGIGHTGGHTTPTQLLSGSKFASPSYLSFGQVPSSFNPNNTDLIGEIGPFIGNTYLTGQTIIPTTNSERIATAYGTMFLSFSHNHRIPYVDLDTTRGGGELHVNLVNLNGGKTAGDSGAVHVRFGMIAAS